MTGPRQPQDHTPPARKTTVGSKKRAQQALDAETFGLRVDGVDYILNPNDMTGSVERKIRNELGRSFAQLQVAFEREMGIDLLGELMWAIRFANGERDLLLDDVLDSVSYASSVEEIKDPEPAPKA
jgi:hypothetical protein